MANVDSVDVAVENATDSGEALCEPSRLLCFITRCEVDVNELHGKDLDEMQNRSNTSDLGIARGELVDESSACRLFLIDNDIIIPIIGMCYFLIGSSRHRVPPFVSTPPFL